MKRWIVAGLLATTMGTSTAHAAIIDCIVARINDEIVTQSDVRSAMIPYLLQNNQNPAILKDPAQASQIMDAALLDLIDRKLIEQEAKKIDYSIPDADLDKWLEFTRGQQNLSEEQFRAVIEQQGISYPDYREMVRANLLKVRIINIKVGSQITITDQAVDAEYKKRFGSASGKVAYRTISHILIRPDADTPEARKAAYDRAVEIRKRIDAGESFPDVAADVSEGPSKESKGLLGTYRRGELDSTFEASAFSLAIGEVSQPVETKFGYHLIFVSGEEERDDPEIEQRKELVRAELRNVELERLLKQYMSQLKSRAFVEVKPLCAAY
ncbi:MAG: peptidylprolyl isomerase [bacterium]